MRCLQQRSRAWGGPGPSSLTNATPAVMHRRCPLPPTRALYPNVCILNILVGGNLKFLQTVQVLRGHWDRIGWRRNRVLQLRRFTRPGRQGRGRDMHRVSRRGHRADQPGRGGDGNHSACHNLRGTRWTADAARAHGRS